MNRRSLLLLLSAPFFWGCASEGLLEVSLLRAGIDQDTADVSNYRVELLDEALAITDSYQAPSSELPRDLAKLSAGQRFRLRVLGFSDSTSTPLAMGISRPVVLEEESSLQLPVPFSSSRVLTALPRALATNDRNSADGFLDDWVGSPSGMLDQSSLLAGPGGSGDDDFRAFVYLSWDETWLHLALEIQDDCPALKEGDPAGSCGIADRIDKIYFGFNGSGAGTGGFSDGDLWVEVWATAAFLREGSMQEDDIKLAMGQPASGKGWHFEVSVLLSALGKTAPLGPTDRIGIGLLVIDADPGDDMFSVYGMSTTALGANSTVVAPVNMFGIGFPEQP